MIVAWLVDSLERLVVSLHAAPSIVRVWTALEVAAFVLLVVAQLVGAPVPSIIALVSLVALLLGERTGRA